MQVKLESQKVVRPKELLLIAKHCLIHNFPLLIKGRLGTGKTQICFQAALEAGFKPENIVIESPHMKEITDYVGLPFAFYDAEKNRQKADFLPINTLEKMLESKEPMVFIFDELDKAKLTMNAVAQIICQREISGRKIPDYIRFIATCNLPEEETGGGAIKPHLLDRFFSVVELKPSVEDWAEYILKKYGINAIVLVSFVRFRPQYILDGQNTELALSIEKTPTARTLENFLKILLSVKECEERKTIEPLLAGVAGDEFYIEFKAFSELFHSSLPTFEEIATSPHEALIPTRDKDIILRHAIVGMLSSRVNEDTFVGCVKYLLRAEWNSFASLRRVFLEQVKILKPQLLDNHNFVPYILRLITE